MTDALVGGLDATASDGIASLPGPAVVQPPGTIPQKADQLPDLLSGLASAWLQGRHLMHVLPAVVVVQDLHSGRKDGVDLLPDPLRPIAEHTQAHLVLGDQ